MLANASPAQCLAVAFALAVTEETNVKGCWIPAQGAHSLFRSVEMIFPQVVTSQTGGLLVQQLLSVSFFF